ncbi:MAG TPA: hypothetical protein VES73_13515 [Lamprocystis sp. (in: g-proteobacteria)]|nr:hypothetical protein [Lamprocystis sp. (in: g-proteobacteria)]
MQKTPASFTTSAAIAILGLVAGCAGDMQEKENLAVAAGFKAITPTKADQVKILQTLPTDKITPVNYQGKTYYVLPDVKSNQAFVGGPNQYQAYQQLRLARQLSNENLEAAAMNQQASMNWGAWGGWGAGPGLY